MAAGRAIRAALDTEHEHGRRLGRQQAWAELPERIRRMRHQFLGQMTPGCSATYGVHEACDFSCTACYLAESANRTPALPFSRVKQQLDAIRARLGPAGGVQITAGEVTLLPAEELIRIVRYARDIGLDPMVMTHGQRFDRDPGYLKRLVVEGGLQKVAIHIDSTQRGRDGQAKHATEQDLMPIRDRFADLIRRIRRETGRPLYASHTFTVTQDNAAEVPAVMRWMLRNADAFRMISFQPAADVGRTRTEEHTGGRRALWDRVCEGLGAEVNPHTFVMGHPSCNNVSLMWLCEFDGEQRIVEVKRAGRAVDERFFDALLSGSFRGFHIDGADRATTAGKVARLMARSPKYLWQWPAYALYRIADGHMSWLPRFVRAAITGRPWAVRPFAVIAHHFMSAHELDTPEGQERLAACSFRVPVDGRMVPMCELNGSGLRKRLNEEDRARLVPAHAVARPRR